MLKLNDELLLQFIVNRCHGEWTCFIGKKVAIVCALQMKLQIYNNTPPIKIFF